MPPDLQFIDANINNHQDIPASLYPVLTGVSLTGVAVNSMTSVIQNGILPDGNGIFVTWSYPVTDDLFVRVAVGYQFQVMEGTFGNDQLQAPIPSGPVVFEQIVNFNTMADPNNFINLQAGANGRVDIPAGLLMGGFGYTARVRALVFSELGAGTVGGQYFKYTEWGSVNFKVNNSPSAISLRVNGIVNPPLLAASDGVTFSFTFNDTDGPSYFYKVQVGTTPGVGFSANIWDSGLISGGVAFGNKDISVPYTGAPLADGVIYAWRVNVNDSLSDGGFTPANDTFKINTPPIVNSLRIDTDELLFGDIPVVGNSGAVLDWDFFDAEGDTQRAYNLEVSQIVQQLVGGQLVDQKFDIVNTGNVFSSASTYALPVLPEGGLIQVTLSVRDSIEFGEAFTGSFSVNASPDVVDLLIDGKTNPGDVASPTPLISWTFVDADAGDIQQAFRIQVASDQLFANLLWDSGNVSSFSSSAVYGSTPSPIVSPVALTHGAYYFVQVSVSDGISFSDFVAGFFAVNAAPNSPTILTPSAGAFSGPITVTWLAASPLDPDGDPVLYTLELTSRRSTNQGWEYLAGPFPSTQLGFLLDTSNIKSGTDYGVRVLANDGFSDSDPTLGTSPLNASGLGFTILNHPPGTPVFVSPVAGIASLNLRIEWFEANPVDVDGDTVFYILEMTRDASVVSPTYEKIGVFNEGTTKTILDISNLPDGSNYKLRITAQDDKGAMGQTNYSQTFSVVNSATITDFESLADTVYVGTSDGRIFKANETIWQVDNDFTSQLQQSPFEVFSRGTPLVRLLSGMLVIQSPPGSTFILRVSE